MAERKSIYLVGDSDLPFLRQRPTSFDNAKGTDGASSSSAPVQDIARPPGLSMRELVGRPTLDWPIQLPLRDPRGVVMGPDFECWKKAREGRTGISGNWYSIKTGRMNACHSMLEATIHAYLDMCPFVVEFRTQYPSWDQEEYARYHAAGKRFPKNKVMTVDFMVTLALPGLPYLVYHGISGKPRALIAAPKTISRHEREVSAISRWGSTHEVMDEFVVTRREFANYLLLKQWFLWTDISSNMGAAYELSETVKRSNARGPLDRVLPMIGRRLGRTRDESYRLLAVAVFLGYLWLDHRRPLDIQAPLVLLAEE